MRTMLKGQTSAEKALAASSPNKSTPAVTLSSSAVSKPEGVVGPPAGTAATSLWGIWEMWCDFPMKSSAAFGGGAAFNKGSSSSSMSDKLQQAQSPTWLDTIRSLGLFDTAEGFWGIHECTLPPSRLPNGANYYLFRHNVAPMWEQEANRRGGKWVAQFTVEQGGDVDRAWMELCMAAVGEQMPCSEEELCGVCVSKRRSGYKVSVWTRTASDADMQTSIGAFIRSLVFDSNDKITTPLKFLPHCEILDACGKASSPLSSGSAAELGGQSPRSPTSAEPARVPEPLYVA